MSRHRPVSQCHGALRQSSPPPRRTRLTPERVISGSHLTQCGKVRPRLPAALSHARWRVRNNNAASCLRGQTDAIKNSERARGGRWIINVANKRERASERARATCARRSAFGLCENRGGARGSRTIEFSVETKTLGFPSVFLTLSANGLPHKSPLMAGCSPHSEKLRKWAVPMLDQPGSGDRSDWTRCDARANRRRPRPLTLASAIHR